MKQHRSDLVALLFGLAFTIAGALVMVSQATGVDVDPHWGAATGLIVLGAVALVATVARARRDVIDHRMSSHADAAATFGPRTPVPLDTTFRASGSAPNREESTG